MTEQATEKQVKFAISLGIENPTQYDKQTLKGMISAKVGPTDEAKAPQSAPMAQTDTVVLTRTDKPHSYEFGKASARHKIYYSEVSELQTHIDCLNEAHLIDNDVHETQKI